MYYKVIMPRGHQGTNRRKSPCSNITFVFEAPTATAAVKRAQAMPGVKHDKMPLMVSSISREEYYTIWKISAYQRQ